MLNHKYSQAQVELSSSLPAAKAGCTYVQFNGDVFPHGALSSEALQAAGYSQLSIQQYDYELAGLKLGVNYRRTATDLLVYEEPATHIQIATRGSEIAMMW